MSGPTMLYEQSAFPIFQNRIYDSAQEARAILVPGVVKSPQYVNRG
jgi:hypothetical protein